MTERRIPGRGGGKGRGDGEKPGDDFVKLRFSSRAKETFASVFLNGRYAPSTQALIEFTDNSVGYRSRDRQHATTIHVDLDETRDKIRIIDYGGLGADRNGIKFFFGIGDTKYQGIGQYGGGAKFAAFHFGNDFEIRAKKASEPIEYSTKIERFGDPTTPYKGQYPLNQTPSSWDTDKGRFEVIIRKLKNLEQLQLPSRGYLKRALGEVYRPLLARKQDGFQDRELPELPTRTVVDAKGNFHQVNDRVSITISKKRQSEEVEPLPIPLLPQYSEYNIQIAETPEGEKMWYWAGEMDLSNDASKKVEPGIRFYYDGRLITVDYCGFDKKDYRLSGLTGEVHLDHVKGIKEQLSVNKSGGVNQRSDQWQRVRVTMHEALAPLIEQMRDKSVTGPKERPAFLDKVMKDVKNAGDIGLMNLEKTGVVDPEFRESLVGETKGQRHRSKVEHTGTVDKDEKKPGRRGTPWDEQQKRTIPDIDINEAYNRPRKSYIHNFELEEHPDQEQKVSFIQNRESEGKKGVERILIINNANPTVQLAFKEGDLASALLLTGEYAEHLAREGSPTLEEYPNIREALRFQMDKVIFAKPEYQRMSVAKEVLQEMPPNQEEIE